MINIYPEMRDGHIKIISKFKRDLSDKVKMNKYEDYKG